MLLTFLGTGTSTGVPQMRCNCSVCTSNDPHDNRLRASVLLQTEPGAPAILIDCGPDFRQQMLSVGCPDLACALLTHTHYDHVGGVDDLRPYTHAYPGLHFPLYCRADVAHDLRNRIPYCFKENPYPGVPQFDLRECCAGDVLTIEIGVGYKPVEVEVLGVMHAKLPILGFRIGKFAYITDANFLSRETIKRICGLDTLVLNALRKNQHPSHFSLAEALEVVNEIKPKQTFFTHMSHDIGLHAEINRNLPANVQFAYDGLQVEV